MTDRLPSDQELIDRVAGHDADLAAVVADRLDELAIDARVQQYNVNLAEFNPAPDVRIVLSLPSTAPREAFDAAAKGLKRYFPEHQIIVMHDDAKLETKDEV